MRETKFRAWDKKKKVWNPVFSLKEFHKGLDNYSEDLIYLQFTGLLDKNENEIYKSDLVRIRDTEIIGEIVWFNLSWQIRDGGMLCMFSKDDLEVIGNVFENPELLGGGE